MNSAEVNPWYGMLYGFAQQDAKRFKERQPFPHVVIDNFLPQDILKLAHESFPDPGSDFWRKTENKNTSNKQTPEGVYGTQLLKELRYSKEMRQVFNELNSGPFCWFLYLLTGIQGIISDPFMIEGGFHSVGDKGRLGIHADFSHNSYSDLERRLNLLIYLNEDWKEEYGGALQLYAKDLTPTHPIWPADNRAVIFETSESSFHGHPEPMNLPEGVRRKSLALYYYSFPRPERQDHKAIFPEKK